MSNKLYLILLILTSFNFAQSKVAKFPPNTSETYLEMFEQAYNRLKTTYVDSIDGDQLINSAVRGMTNSLDPYTKLLVGDKKDQYEQLVKGKYGGVGMKISSVRDTLTIVSVFEDSPSYSEGLMAGDQILKIDSTDVIKLPSSSAVKLLKGELNTDVKIHILRNPGKQKLEFNLTRSNINLKRVSYWGLDNDIGYIKITKFGKGAGEETKNAISSMLNDGMNSLIIDLRSNTGGLLREARSILDIFFEPNTMLVETRGNNISTTLQTREEKIIDDYIPIVILQNRGSASASEIVSGVFQDMDRAVVLGQKSFGKGLVQRTYSLTDSSKLKVTISKYYTPSGRLIQKQDYLDNGVLTDGLDKRDSTFFTIGGRIVKGGGGITPDIKTIPEKMSSYLNALWKEKLFLSFASKEVPVFINDALKDYYNMVEDILGQKEITKIDSNYLCLGLLDKKNKYNWQNFISQRKEIEAINETVEIMTFISTIKGKLSKAYNKKSPILFEEPDNVIEILKSSSYVVRNHNLSSTKNMNVQDLTSIIKDSELKDKSIAELEIRSILIKLLGLINKLDSSKILDDAIDLIQLDNQTYYLNVDLELDQKSNEIEKIKIQNDRFMKIIEWSIDMLYKKENYFPFPYYLSMNKISFNNFKNKDYRSREIKINDILKKFKNHIDLYEFKFLVNGEKEFNRLKTELQNLPEFSNSDGIENISDFPKPYAKNKKVEKLTSSLNKFFKKKKEKYFYEKKNEKWMLNGIIREISREILGDSGSIKSSLFIDSDYLEAVYLLNDLYRYDKVFDTN